jgi:hypothetical protein
MRLPNHEIMLSFGGVNVVQNTNILKFYEVKETDVSSPNNWYHASFFFCCLAEAWIHVDPEMMMGWQPIHGP